MVSWMKAQGASEYLILLAVVLIVGMVAISLLGGFTNIGGDARFVQSNQYWSGASPVSIQDSSQYNSTLSLDLQNMQSDRIVITNVSVTDPLGSSTGSAVFSPGITFNGGAKRVVSITNLTACNLSTYNIYEYTVSITYSTNDIAGNVEHGAKPLSGKCTPA